MVVVQSAVGWPCDVCGGGIGDGSIQCTGCQRWVYRRCNGVWSGMYRVMGSFVCGGCVSSLAVAGCAGVDVGGSASLELVDGFCCLVDMLGMDGSAGVAVGVGVRVGWSRFRWLVPLLASGDILLMVRRRLCGGCCAGWCVACMWDLAHGKGSVVALRRVGDGDGRMDV